MNAATNPVDVLAVMDRMRGAMNGDASQDVGQVYSDSLDARAAVSELIEAAGNYARRYAMDEASVDGDEATGCSRQQHLDAVALFAALARVGGAK